MIEIYVRRDVFLVPPPPPPPPLPPLPEGDGVKPGPLGRTLSALTGNLATPGNDHVWDVLNVEHVCGVRDAHELRIAPGKTVGLYPDDPPEGVYLVLLLYPVCQTGIQFSPTLVEFAKDVSKPLFIHNPNQHYVILDLSQPLFVAIARNLFRGDGLQ